MRPMLYRVFLASLTVFFLGMSVFGGMPARAQGADDPWLVKGVSVDVTAGSAIEARKKAFAEARRKAYEQLAGQLVSEADRPNIVIPDDRVLSSLVRDLEIVQEKMTSRRYVGTVDIRFTPAAVKRTLQVSAAPQGPSTTDDVLAAAPGPVVANPTAGMGEEYIYSPRHGAAVRTTVPANNVARPAAASPRAILILPWYGQMGRQTLWGQSNPWRAAWEESAALSRDKSVPIVLPVGDVDDLRDYSPPQPMSRRGDIDNLMKRYKATEAVLAMAEPNDQGGAVISLYRYDNGAPVPIGRFGVDASARDVLGEGVQKAAAALRAMPASVSAGSAPAPTPVAVTSPGMISPVPVIASPPVGGTYHTLARFSGLQEWVAMRNALSRVPGLGVVGIRSISPSQANIEFTYTGDYANLAQAMIQSGLQLSPLPAGTVTAGGATPQFLLSTPRGY